MAGMALDFFQLKHPAKPGRKAVRVEYKVDFVPEDDAELDALIDNYQQRISRDEDIGFLMTNEVEPLWLSKTLAKADHSAVLRSGDEQFISPKTLAEELSKNRLHLAAAAIGEKKAQDAITARNREERAKEAELAKARKPLRAAK